MSLVLSFPDELCRQWRLYEANLRPQLASIPGMSADDVSRVLGVIRPIYFEAGAAKKFEGNTADDALQAMSNWLAGLTGRLLAEIAVREAMLICGRR